MIEAFLSGFLSLMTWGTWLAMIVGVVVGFVMGLIPGLGGVIALAVLLPFTFDLPATQAFALLLGMATVTGTTGDITATLFGVPGEPTSAANVVDGFPMTKRGEGGRAIGAVLSSSLIGAIFGAAVLAASIPIVRPLVLSFGAPEFFAVIVVGLALISGLGRGAMLKAVIAAMAGLLLSTIGLDGNVGIPRFTGGFLELWDGLGLVPVAMGLFAVPELVDVAVRGTSIASPRLSERGSTASAVMEGVKDTFRHFGLTLRCSGIGAFIGLLPGLGSSVAQWIAYSHAVQSSPKLDKDGNERFGNGAIEGVIGPGAANNSKEGGGLIPTIAFGVPGSLTAAILLGAFLIHGLVPGRQMLTTELPLTMSFVSVIVISNILAVALALATLKPIIKLTQLRPGLLLPIVLLLVFLGTYASSGQLISLVVLLAFGVLGIVMILLGWPRPPLILGFVLGGLGENYFGIAVARYGYAWLVSPKVLAIFGFAILVLLYPMLSARRSRRRLPGEDVDREGER